MGRRWVLAVIPLVVVAAPAVDLRAPAQHLPRPQVSPTPAPNEVGGATVPMASRSAPRRRSCFPPIEGPLDTNRPRSDPSWAAEVHHVVAGHDLGLAVGVGERIAFAHDAAAPRTPASNQKLLLSMTLLEVFGAQVRVPTIVRMDRGGDLYLIGRGDPTFGDASYRAALGLRDSSAARLARDLAAEGIERIRGDVIAVGSYFTGDWNAPGWQSYVRQTYVTRPTALSFNANTTTRQSPEMQVATSVPGALESAGIAVDGDPRTAARGRKGRTISRIWSPPLIELIEIMNRNSSNFFAEVLSKRLGARCFGPPGTIEKGARAIRMWAGSLGVRIVAHDASGLSYDNRLSPRQMVSLLTYAASRPWGRVLRRALPGAGEGTLAHRLSGVPVAAKTGSLFDGSSALAGWVWMSNVRRWAAFSVMSSLGSSAAALEDQIVRTLSSR